MYTGLFIILVPLFIGYLLPWHQPALLQQVIRLLNLLLEKRWPWHPSAGAAVALAYDSGITQIVRGGAGRFSGRPDAMGAVTPRLDAH